MACKEGYYGRFCIRPCPLGRYGADCAGRCYPVCSDKNCDHVTGCINDGKITTKGFKTEIEIAASIMRKTTQTESTNTRLIPIQTNVEFVTDDPTTRNEINTKYMLAGGGIFLALFLFVIFLQLYTCKKTKLTNTKQLQQNICEERDTTDELKEDTQNEIQRTLSTSYRARNGDRLNALPQSVYDDIDESLEIRHTQSFLNESQKYEQHHLSKPNLSYSPLSFHRFNYQSDVPFIGPSDVNRSDLYLQPISVRKTADVDCDQITC